MSEPKTWEQATQDVVAGLDFRTGEGWTLDEVLESVENVLDALRHSSDLAESHFRTLAWYGAVGYVLEKFGPATKGSTQINFVQRCNDVVKSTLVLLPKKQHDYGPDNILWGGVQGVVVRAHDKLARIKNLKKRIAGPKGGYVANEPLADSYFDLIGYGIVGAMLVKGTFQLPLEADLRKQEIVHYGSGKKGEELVASLPNVLDEEQVRKIVRETVAVEVAKLATVMGALSWPT